MKILLFWAPAIVVGMCTYAIGDLLGAKEILSLLIAHVTGLVYAINQLLINPE